MVAKSIIDVDVNDASFKAFAALYAKYEAALDKMPDKWKAQNKEIGEGAKGFQMMAAAQLAQTELIRRAVTEQEKGRTAAQSTAQWWSSIARSTKTAVGNIDRITMSLLKWTALTSVFSGLLGIGGLFGIERMAMSTGNARRSASGLGITSGQQHAFDINYGRVVDPGFLGQVNEALTDVTKRRGLYGAGLSDRDLAGKNTAQVAALLVPALKKIADQTPTAQMAQVLASRGLDQFVSAQDLQRLKNTPAGEIAGLGKRNATDAGGLNVDPEIQRKWQNFTAQMARAGQGIENVFVRGLVRLEPGLERLSGSVEKVVAAFADSPQIKKWLDEAGAGLETFAKYLGTDEFQDKVTAFVDGLGKLGSGIARIVRWFADVSPTGGVSEEKEGHDTWNEMVRGAKEKRARRGALIGGVNSEGDGAASVFKNEAYIREAAIKRGIDPEVALKVARSEGLYKYVGDRGSSFGPFQLHYGGVASGGMAVKGLGDEFTKATGLDARDPSTVQRQIDFALDRAMKAGWGEWHGWKGDQRAGLPRTVVEVRNNTGGSAVITTNQVSQP